MASRKIKNTIILAIVAAVAGADSAPASATNAILVSEMSITPLDAQNIERKNIRGSFGGNAELVGPASVKCSITVELAGSGAAGTAPAWGQLLQGCAMAEGILATPARVEYTPVSTGLKDLTIYYYDDGVLHKLIGVMGTCTLTAKVGERAMLKFDFTGVDGTMSAVSNPVADYTAWKQPVALTKANVVDITLGATYAAGAITSGTSYPSNGLEIMFGNEVNFIANLSAEKVEIAERNMTGSAEFELTAAQEVAFMTKVKTNVLQSLAFTIGLTSGNQIIVHGLSVQMTNPKKVDVKGNRYNGYDMRFLPVAGNDELRLACV